MFGQELPRMKDDIGFGEGDIVTAGEGQLPAFADIRQNAGCSVGIEPLGLPACQTEDRGGVGCMTAPGQCRLP